MFTASLKDRHRHYVTVPALWQKLEAHSMSCVPSPPMFVYYFSAFSDSALCFGHLLLETAMTAFTFMLFICFIQIAEYGVAHLFMPARFWALTEGGRLCANEGALVSLSRETRAIVLERGLSRLISNCAEEQVAAISAFARVGETDWAALDCGGCFLYDFADAVIISVPK